MAFVRIKRISGKEYAYLVTNSWTGSGPRQKVAKYLGRVIRPQKAKSEPLGAFLGLTNEKDLKDWIGKNSFGEIAAALLRLELKNHSIRAQIGLNPIVHSALGGIALAALAPLSTPYGTFKISAEKAEFLDGKSKPVVFALNDGFLCGHTAKKLLEYEPATDYTGYNLADALTAAGVAADKDVFIEMFGKMQAAPKKQQATEENNKDFYY